MNPEKGVERVFKGILFFPVKIRIPKRELKARISVILTGPFSENPEKGVESSRHMASARQLI